MLPSTEEGSNSQAPTHRNKPDSQLLSTLCLCYLSRLLFGSKENRGGPYKLPEAWSIQCDRNWYEWIVLYDLRLGSFLPGQAEELDHKV